MATVTQKQIRDLNEKIDKTKDEKLKEELKKKLEILTKDLVVNK